MFQLKALQGKSAKDLRRLHEVFTHSTMSLTNLGHPQDGLALVYLVGSKLDPESRELWEREVVRLPRTSMGKAGMPDEDMLFQFVQQRARTLEHTPNLSKGFQGGVAKKNFVTTKNASGETTAPEVPALAASGRHVPRVTKKYPPRKPEPCGHCQGAHRIWACETFKGATEAVKRQTIAKAKLCYNCLGSGHGLSACTSTFKCKVCQARHHTLLHFGPKS